MTPAQLRQVQQAAQRQLAKASLVLQGGLPQWEAHPTNSGVLSELALPMRMPPRQGSIRSGAGPDQLQQMWPLQHTRKHCRGHIIDDDTIVIWIKEQVTSKLTVAEAEGRDGLRK